MIRLLVLLGLFEGSAAAAEPALRYDFQAGDDVVYREKFAREVRGAEIDYALQSEWEVRLLVIAGEDGRFVVGFQRNRRTVDLVRYREEGKDKLKQGREELAERLASSPPYNVEATHLDALGRPLGPWSAVREERSELLPYLHEIEALPGRTVHPGESWMGLNPLQLTHTAAGWESIDGDSCLRIEGRSPLPGLAHTLWFSPAMGLIRRLSIDGSYPGFEATVHETLSTELVSRRRGVSRERWLAAPETRPAVLVALDADPAVAVDPATLGALIDAADPGTTGKVLSIFYKRGMTPPPSRPLADLALASDPSLRRWAVRLLRSAPSREAQPLIMKALEDGSAAVRDAAVAWIRGRSTEPQVETDTETILRNWSSLLDRPRAATLPAAKTAPSGTTLRPMSGGAWAGYPYALHVPADYTGDEPVPLMIYMSGGPGRALTGVWQALSTEARSCCLIAFPQAVQAWWTPQSGRMCEQLMCEIMAQYNVDPERVFVVGTSNGGTGAFWLSTVLPHRFAAAVSLMGAGQFPPSGDPAFGINAAHVPLLFVHGDRDDVINMGASKDTVDQLKRDRRDARLEFRMLRGRGHEITLDQDDGLALPFLLAQRRDVFPDRIQFKMRTLDFPRQYWARIDEKDGGVAEVEGRIAADGTIRIETHGVRILTLLLRRELIPPGSLRITANGKTAYVGEMREDATLLERTSREAGDPRLGWSFEVKLDLAGVS